MLSTPTRAVEICRTIFFFRRGGGGRTKRWCDTPPLERSKRFQQSFFVLNFGSKRWCGTPPFERSKFFGQPVSCIRFGNKSGRSKKYILRFFLGGWKRQCGPLMSKRSTVGNVNVNVNTAHLFE